MRNLTNNEAEGTAGGCPIYQGKGKAWSVGVKAFKELKPFPFHTLAASQRPQSSEDPGTVVNTVHSLCSVELFHSAAPKPCSVALFHSTVP
ncbi:hypothetical protein NQZ68_015625 [Dissostichus eleginoides]|nr:hypothetical protein NQZ68_015625 [Dissostichus eleginoides]